MRFRIFSLFLVIGVFMTSASWGQVNLLNSPHNLSVTSPADIHATVDDGTGSDEVCVFCHTPHNAGNQAIGPLWNRNYDPAVGGAWTFYDSATHDAGPATLATLGGQSLACLSCHDGTLAFDALVNAPGPGVGSTATWAMDDSGTGKMAPAGTFAAAAWANLGRDLSNDHPVGIDYDAALLADGVGPGSGGFLAKASLLDVQLYTHPVTGLDQVECASCHNPHDWDGPLDNTRMFLRADTAASAICLRCHAK